MVYKEGKARTMKIPKRPERVKERMNRWEVWQGKGGGMKKIYVRGR